VIPPSVALEAVARHPPLAFPCVVKPPMLSGSQGVIRADAPEALARALERVRQVLHRHPSPLRSEAGFFDLLVEGYVDGEEVAVEGLMRSGELQLFAIFDKPDALEGPYFEETIYLTPSRKDPEPQRQLVAAAEAAALALGLGDGPIHAELRLDAEGPVLIEIAARSIGGLCSRALRHQLGSLEERLLRHAVGLPAEALPAAAPASGVMMIPVPRSGVLRGVEGVDEARAVAGIDAVEITIERGETVRALPDGASYLGFLFAHGATAMGVEAALRRAHGALRFQLHPLLHVLG
jgi:biotin carboxylase